MARIHVVGDYRQRPTEGIQVTTKAVVEGLRGGGHQVSLLNPIASRMWPARLLASRPDHVVFTHGPGRGVVVASALLRRLTHARVVWVATRPDLAGLPDWIGHAGPTAHSIVCNRPRADLASAAPGAEMVQQFIGVDPHRTAHLPSGTPAQPWPELTSLNRPIALHIGHLRPNRGLDLLADAKRQLGDMIEIVVQGSPTFPPDRDVLSDLTRAGVHVHHGFVEDLAGLYSAADLYVFPARPEEHGAIELPLGVLEAVACRTPVLTTDFGAVRAALGTVQGVHFTTPDRLAGDLKEIVTDEAILTRRPDGLPSTLDASRVVNAVLTALRLS